ncbi:SAVED domain-containing protein [Salinicola sp. V024]|uniref:SAVED domain-containing protein n=1 Tax=Salinicola sp. V024 TaxID=3459609 RepID=UPI004044950A
MRDVGNSYDNKETAGMEAISMALNQVGARTEGDVFQGLFFWRQAADLLRPASRVERVVLEHDEADGVDDVAVFYRKPGVNAGGWMVSADYFQLKYHVDNRNSYSSDALIDPGFINAKSSLLQRFHSAYTNLASEHADFRLHLASNWRWKDDDKLAQLLREYDGELPRKFFDDGPRGDLGKVRERWRTHLGLEDDAFRAFAKTLRFQLDHFGRRDFKTYVYTTLEVVGLKTPSADRTACPYQSLIQQFLMNGPNSFDETSFRELCEREGLLTTRSCGHPRPLAIGVRSFVRFAERLESEVDEMICVSNNFEGRHLASGGSWYTATSQLLSFLSDPDRRARLRGVPSAIALECHGSFALLAGWELSRNSGVDLAPIQKPSLEIWSPSPDADCATSWIAQEFELASENLDIAICLSVTHDVRADVEAFLTMEGAPQVGRLVVVSPDGGPSPQSIKGPDYAYRLAVQFPSVLAKARRSRAACAHIFFACPNALMFFIGQQREALGRVTLYEFDFGIEKDGSYSNSISLPVAPSPRNEAHEVPDDSTV